jgi:cardiolipin synthase
MSQVKIDFHTQTKDAWTSMLGDIRQAKHSIIIEQYIFVVDSIGKQFVELLREKVKEGVKIKLLCDTVGSYGFYRSLLPRFLIEQGIEVRFFNLVRPWRITNFTSNLFRDHRKIMIIDDEIAHVSGVGIQEHMANWRDTHMRVTGPLVEHIQQSFQNVWDGAKKKVYIHYEPFKTSIKNYELLTNSPSIRQRYMYHTLMEKIRNAKKSIFLTTPYFIPDVPLYRALFLATKRDVDIQILVPEVADHIFVNHARESYFSFLLRSGIKIFVYTPTMMHAKTAIVDDEWATTGSFNLDSLSFFFNHEANVASDDIVFVNELKNHFLKDLESCREITLEEWRKRPLRKKILELVSWLFHGIM